MRISILFLAIIYFLSCSEENNLIDNNQNELISNDQELLIDISDDTNQSLTESNNLSFLALGDSYTIGESVSENQRWPNQMINIALNEDLLFEQPIIIAKTGWRTKQLIDTLNKINFIKKFDYVSLMIGVNNQYSLKSIDTFRLDLIKLLDMSIGYTKKEIMLL